MSLIRVRDLHRTYRTLDGPRVATEQKVFSGFDLDIEEGQMVAIVGPSGCGKSTLLNLIGGLDSVSARQVSRIETEAGRQEVPTLEGRGTIHVGRFEVSAASAAEKADFRNRKLGFVFQFHHLVPELSALDNVALPRMIRGKSRAAARRAAVEMLERVDLAHHGDKQPAVLSGGERQRVAIARALVNRPEVVLADEPTGSLDPGLKGTIFDLLRELHEKDGITIVLVTHDLSLLAQGGRSRVDRTVELTAARRHRLEPVETHSTTQPGGTQP